MERLNGHKLDDELLTIIKEETTLSNVDSVNPGVVFSKLRTKFWDVELADIRWAVGQLLADGRVVLTFERRFKPVETVIPHEYLTES